MKKKKALKQRLKKTARKIHLYLGILTGLIVFILALTGACLSFQDEIRDLSADYKVVDKAATPRLAASEIKALAQAVFPDKAIHGAVFGKETDAIEVIFYEAEPTFYQKVYLNPYTGEVLHVEDYLSGFLAFALKGHKTLWLPKPIGEVLVSYGTFLFLFVLLSGIVLWWPKNKRHLKQSLRFKWTSKTSLKKKIFSVHTVMGFYLSIFALIIAMTGAIIGLNWFYFIVFKAVGGTKAPQFIVPNNVSEPSNYADNTFYWDQLIPKVQKQIPNHESLELHYPESDSMAIYLEVSYTKGVYYNSDYRFYDQYSLQELNTNSIYGTYEQADFADKVIRMSYDIHVGAIFGLFGKIFVFCVSILLTILPLTGFWIWIKRRQERKMKLG
ncbi:PepSY-associated TM helix domain-containing protein [Aureispira anguillae]|uniref:PepSY domain-containing protein n=1 Tax=Aureispira anguillae TaxID=2864201 RepID=A0A916DSK2_9BACT|nr:PepSY-associated TM helix domain-containing protein [Aureispira anguillae]BDS11215.1 PepSY domain-containing protein [Aureispira anguillae]